MNPSEKYYINFDSKSTEVDLTEELVIGNTGFEGYFGVTYDMQTWDKLIQILQTNNLNFTLSQKLSLLISSFICSYAQQEPFNVTLSVFQSLSNDQNEYTWVSASTLLTAIAPLYQSQQYWPDMQNYIGNIYTAISNFVGWSSSTNPLASTSLRSTVLLMSTWFENQQVVSEGINITKNFIENQTFYISPESRRSAFFSYIRNSNEEDSFDKLYQIYSQTTDSSLKSDIFFALGTSKDLSSVQMVLDIIGNRTDSPSTKLALINNVLRYNKEARTIAFQKSVKIFNELKSLKNFSIDHYSYVRNVVYYFRAVVSNEQESQLLSSFLRENLSLFGTFFSSIQSNSVSYNFRSVLYNSPFLENFFTKK